MSILIVQQPDVPPLLPMSECIDIMEDALKTLAGGGALMPLRGHMWLPEKVGELTMMPAYLSDIGVLGLKVITYFPGKAKQLFFCNLTESDLRSDSPVV